MKRQYADAPGTKEANASWKSWRRYSMDFRIETFCRCKSSDDYYTGDSVEFSFDRTTPADSEIKNVKFQSARFGDANPSQYPEY